MLINASALSAQYLFTINLSNVNDLFKFDIIPFGIPLVFTLNIPGLSILSLNPVTELEAITIERNSTKISSNPANLEEDKEYKTISTSKKISFEVKMPSNISTQTLADIATFGGASLLGGNNIVSNATSKQIGSIVPNPFILPFKTGCEYLYETSKDKFIANQLVGYASLYGTNIFEKNLFLTGFKHSQVNAVEIFTISLERQPKKKNIGTKIVGS
jgi:hypothetical protein